MYCSSRVRDSDSGPIVSTDVIGYDSLFGKFSFGGLYGTEEVFLIPLRVQIPTLPIFFLLTA